MVLFNKNEREQKIDKQKEALKQFHHATIVSKTIIDQVEHFTINGVGKVDGNKVELKYSLERVNDQFGAKESGDSSVTVADKLSPKEQVEVFKAIYTDKDKEDKNTVTFDNKSYKVINLEEKSGNLKGYYDAFKEHTDKISLTISDMLEGSFKTLFHSSNHQFAGDFNASDNTIVDKNSNKTTYVAASNLGKATVYNYCLQQGDEHTDHCELLNPDNNPMINELFFES